MISIAIMTHKESADYLKIEEEKKTTTTTTRKHYGEKVRIYETLKLSNGYNIQITN